MSAQVSIARESSFLDGLNPQQREAVLHIDGPAFLVAGPGSGKTSVIVRRLAYMIEQGVRPESMIAFTFTRKAANELKERVVSLIGDDAGRIMIGTYHSVCGRLLRRFAYHLGYESNFSIYDTEDSAKTLKKLCEPKAMEVKSVTWQISSWKDRMLSPTQAAAAAQDELELKAAEIYREYQAKLRSENAMDFDDLVYNMVYLLLNNEIVRHTVQQQYKYITGDEAQDSSYRDVTLIRNLVDEDTKNFMFVFDNDQAIYAFRGANVEEVLCLPETIPLKIYKLERNYRSTGHIVEASRELIAYNDVRIEKNVFTENEMGNKIFCFEDDSPYAEAAHIGRTIITVSEHFGLQYNDFAILYRTGMQARPIEDVFIRMGIPYELLSGIRFADRKEIKDVTSYLRWVYNPKDLQAFLRIINTPKRGLGDKIIKKIIDEAQKLPGTNSYQAAIELLLEGKLSAGYRKGLLSFCKLTKQIRQVMIGTTEGTTKDLVNIIATEVVPDGDAQRRANVQRLAELADSFLSLEEFLQGISLSSGEAVENQNQVRLMTAHAAKGLEFPHVFVVGLNETLFPHRMCSNSKKEIEEERRLMYVAMTRAQQQLYLTRSRTIATPYGSVQAGTSRFLKEIGENHLHRVR